MKNNSLKAMILLGAISIQACNSSSNNNGDNDSTLTDTFSTDTGFTDPAMSTDTVTDDSGKDPAMFMEKAAIGGMMEIEAGKIAQGKASNAQVKEFAALMIKDHTKASSELKAIAKDKQTTLPASLPAEEQGHLDEMKNLSGAEFDKHYMDMMVNDHKKTVDLFRSATSNPDNDLSTFATKTLTVIEAHHKMAQEINSSLK